MGIISAIFPSHLWLRLCQAGIALALINLLIHLFLPSEGTIAPVLEQDHHEQISTQQIAQWFGGSTAMPELRLHGMIVSGQGGAALLSINQQAVRAYRPGQELAPGVLLDSLQREHIVITVDAVPQQIATERKGPAVIAGIQQGAQP
ncbi:hypothetical protein [Alcaligenes faecalis]|uniref:Type II secretion system protein GspC N-terminal domain-containing protein n=1 Tax=Alcaligenes faecalis TaxID=511 RepID=A0AB33CVF6_ALCFA|nr:hypothetical protein [Alcaligenes faecalis]ASR90525.1 hypothetical protein AFA_14305 [Alcaligenes faecalis]